MNDYILFKNLDHKYLTLPECLKKDEPDEAAKKNEAGENAEAAEANDSDESTIEVENPDGTSATADEADEEPEDTRKTIYYVTDEQQQSQYINMFKEQGMDAVILNHNIDSSFITQLERRNEKYKFMRIDADVTDTLKEDVSEDDLKDETDALTELFRKALNNDKLAVRAVKLKNESVASIITLSEEGRRMQEMMKMYAMGGMGGMDASMFGGDISLTLNANHPLVAYIFEHKDSEHVPMFCEQLYDLAMISNQPLAPEAMTKFITRSNEIMMLLAK